ncbi:MAG TPA: PPOX class F420-dependent oxidoreductase [Aggregatilineaceae bacterium]|nr:PPOX class F420-dependent oxidoreductase [Aggregatilineaceae bacterium]
MAKQIPTAFQDLLENPVFVSLVTIMPDGQPQATPVWIDYDGTYIWVNSARGRQKDQNIERDPRVTILAVDPKNPYRWMEVRGRVETITEAGGVDHINKLSKKYRGIEDYYSTNPERRGQETRVIYKVRPHKVNTNG